MADRGLSYHFKALAIREARGNSIDIAQSYNNIGYMCLRLKDTLAGLDYYEKGLAIRRA
jgi:hypothetical protein